MPDDGLKRIKLSEDYGGQKAGSIYVCDPLRAAWLVDHDHGREATAADLRPKPTRSGGFQPEAPSTQTQKPPTRRRRRA